MKKIHRRRVRRNPTGTLLVNPARRGHKRRVRRNPRRGSASLSSFLRSMGRRVKRHSRRNPLLANPRRRHAKRHMKRRNPLLANPRRRRHSRRNPLLANPRRRRHSRRNPLLANPRRRVSKSRRRHNPIRIRRRRNPGMLSRYQRKAQSLVGRLPVVGGVLGGAIGVLGTSLGGALGVLPVTMIMPHVAVHVPSWMKPYAYTAAGAVLAGLVKAFPDRWFKIPYKGYLATSVAAAGGAVDMYRYRQGQSMSLGSLMLAGPDGDVGYDDIGDIGDIGATGGPGECHEYAGTDLGDAEYAGHDLSDAEIAAAELGRRNYWQRFKGGRRGGSAQDGASDYAGKPGLRHGWLIYWVGFDNFQRIAAMEPRKRQETIGALKTEARLLARKLLTQGQDTSMEQAEMAGLLVA